MKLLKKRLLQTPNDGDLNLLYAETLVLAGKKWDKAVPYFLRSKKRDLVKYINIELNFEVDPTNVSEVLDFYWNFAKTRGKDNAIVYQRHVADYYELVKGDFKGVERLVWEKRLEEISMSMNITEILAKRLPPQWQVQIPQNLMMNFVLIRNGTFMMGSPTTQEGRFSNEQEHEVTITNDYYIAEYEMYTKDCRALTDEKFNPNTYITIPFVTSARDDELFRVASAVCEKLNQLDSARLPKGYVYRLPTEAEWSVQRVIRTLLLRPIPP